MIMGTIIFISFISTIFAAALCNQLLKGLLIIMIAGGIFSIIANIIGIIAVFILKRDIEHRGEQVHWL